MTTKLTKELITALLALTTALLASSNDEGGEEEQEEAAATTKKKTTRTRKPKDPPAKSKAKATKDEEEEEESGDGEVTLKELRTIARPLVQAKKSGLVKELCEEFDAESLTKLDEEHYPEVKERLEEMVADL